MSTTMRHRSQVDPRQAERADRAASRDYATVRPRRAAQSEHEERRFRKADGEHVFLRARVGGPTGLLWDVIAIDGPGAVRVVYAGCWWHREALAKAADYLRPNGRRSFSFSGVAFDMDGGVLRPRREVRGLESTGLRKAKPGAGEVARMEVAVRQCPDASS